VAEALHDPLDPPGARQEIGRHQAEAEQMGLQDGHPRNAP
jgi:hypothetical protein